MKLSKALQNFAESTKEDTSFLVEKAKLDFSMALEKQRRNVGLTYAALAKKISTSAAYITKVFRGDSNLTIESMVKLAQATGGRLNIEIVDQAASAARWDAGAKFIRLDQRRPSVTTAVSATVVDFRNCRPANVITELQKAA